MGGIAPARLCFRLREGDYGVPDQLAEPWAATRGQTILPYDVASYIETMQQSLTAPTVKQQFAEVRMLFDWLITGQVVPHNPASAVRDPKHVVNTGKTPVLDGTEWRKLIDAIPTTTVRDLRDRR